VIEKSPQARRGIVWLASYPKSGNTWLRVFLYHLLRIAGGHPREDDELNRLERASIYETRKVDLFERVLGKPLAAASLAEIMQARPRVQAAIAQTTPGVALVKTHNLLGQVYGMPTVNPQASIGAIYVVRDPRDVAPSLANHLGSTVAKAVEVLNTSGYFTESSAEGASEVWGSWSEHVRSWTADPGPTLLVLRYEDMLADPVRSFTAVAKHLALTATARQIREAAELSSFGRLREQEARTGFAERPPNTERFFNTGKSGTWRERLTDDEVATIVTTHKAEMTRFGSLP
jgi:hypothetical protein